MKLFRKVICVFGGLCFGVGCGEPSVPPETATVAPVVSSSPSAVASPSATVAASTAPPTQAASRSRSAFARALHGLKPGMTDAEVRATLGPPDDVRLPSDPGGIVATRTVEIWRYGTDVHLGFASLGTVHIQADRKVQYVFGGEGKPIEDPTLSEDQLVKLLRILDRVPSYNQPEDPLRLIQAVNALQPLGKDRAVAVISEYLRVSSDFENTGREGTMLVDRTLFDLPPGGYFPRMMVGASMPAPPQDPKTLPRFPIVLVDDIPFNLVTGYELGGQAEPPEQHLKWFVDHASIRQSPLVPTAKPVMTLEKLIGRKNTAFLVSNGLQEDERDVILDQGIRLLRGAIPEEAVDRTVTADQAWAKFKKENASATFTWSADAQAYQRK